MGQFEFAAFLYGPRRACFGAAASVSAIFLHGPIHDPRYGLPSLGSLSAFDALGENCRHEVHRANGYSIGILFVATKTGRWNSLIFGFF